jgi:hypothetical protein
MAQGLSFTVCLNKTLLGPMDCKTLDKMDNMYQGQYLQYLGPAFFFKGVKYSDLHKRRCQSSNSRAASRRSYTGFHRPKSVNQFSLPQISRFLMLKINSIPNFRTEKCNLKYVTNMQ